MGVRSLAKKDIIYLLALGVVIVFSILNYNKTLELQSRLEGIDFLQAEVQNTNHSVQGISSEVQMKLDEFLQGQQWIQEKEYEIINVDLDSNKIKVALKWSLRDLQDDENITLLVREENQESWEELEVVHLGGLNYSAEYTLLLKGNYETQIVASSQSGKRSENLVELNFKEIIENRITINAYLYPSGTGQFDINIDINNPLEDSFSLTEVKEKLKITSAKAFLTVNEKLIKEINLLEENSDYYSEPYGEMIGLYQSLNLEKEIKNPVEAELRVIVEDGLGLKYETTAEN